MIFHLSPDVLKIVVTLFFTNFGEKSPYQIFGFALFSPTCRILHLGKSPAQNRVFPSLRLRFEAKNSRSKIGLAGVFSLGSLLLRSKTNSLTEPAKQRYRCLSFCPDTLFSSCETKPTRTRIFASLFAKLRKLTKCLFLFVRSLFDWVLRSTLSPVFQDFANAIPATFAIRGARFKCNPRPNLALPLFRSCRNLAVHPYANLRKGEEIPDWRNFTSRENRQNG